MYVCVCVCARLLAFAKGCWKMPAHLVGGGERTTRVFMFGARGSVASQEPALWSTEIWGFPGSVLSDSLGPSCLREHVPLASH